MRKNKRNNTKRGQAAQATSISAILITLGMANPALAQQADSAKPADTTVVVTGSRLASGGYLAPTPVTVVDQQEIKLTGTQSLETLLSDSPQFTPNQLSSPTANTIQAGQPSGTSTLNLRNLGPTRTLTLVNGRRFAIDGPDFTTDINTIPAALVQRIETVTGGSSAVYGSDAVAGVVNFIMKDNFEGTEVNAQTTVDQPTHTPTNTLDLTFGRNFDNNKGNIAVSVNYMDRQPVTREQLGGYALPSLGDGCVTSASWSATRPGVPLAVPAGQSCQSAGGRPGLVFSGSATVPNGRIGNLPVIGSSASNPALNAALAAAGLQNMSTLGAMFDSTGKAVSPYTTGNAYDLGPVSDVITPQKRWMTNVFSHYDFSDKATGYLELLASKNTADVQIAPTGVSGNFLVNTNNPYLSPQMQAVLAQLDLAENGTTKTTNGTQSLSTVRGDGLAVINLNRRLSDLGPRDAETDHNVFRIAVGLRGDLDDLSDKYFKNLKYDIYATDSRTTEKQYQGGAVSLSAFQNALLSQGGAAPVLNPFGQNLTGASIDAISVNAQSSIVSEQNNVAANLSGKLLDLPSGEVDFSTGLERRYSFSQYSPSAELASGDVSGWSAALPTVGSESVKEFFGETRVPLLKDKPFAKSLSISGAFRRSDYDVASVGDVWSHSLGAEWAPFESLTFRVQKQKSIRAPNVGELFGGQGMNGPSATDPCSSRQPLGQQTAAVRAVCVATGVPANLVFDPSIQPSNFLTQVVGGNPNLTAETSYTTTIGAVFTPSYIRGLQLSLDYYRISVDNAISTLGNGGIQSVLNLCYDTLQDVNSVYCRAISRDPITGQIGAPNYVQTTNANIASMYTKGFDLDGHYSFGTDWGLLGSSRWTVNSSWTYVPDDIRCAGSFGATCGQPAPHWKGTTRLSMKTGQLLLSANVRYLGSVTVDTYTMATPQPALNTLTNPVIKAYSYLDVSGSYGFTKNINLTAGIRNLLDKDPPVLGSSQLAADNTIPATYDPLGRTFFIALNVKM